MHVTDLAMNQALGLHLAEAGAAHVLEMPETALLLNHVGTIHASAQFALAEAGSGEFLLRELGELKADTFAVLRSSEVKFRKPAHGTLRATARFAEGGGESAITELSARGRALVAILVEIADARGVVTMTGRFDWFLQRQSVA